MWIAVLITLAVPGIAYALWRRKGRDAAGLAWDGVIAGSIPMAVSAVWAVAFMVVYHKSYGERGMGQMTGYKFLHYPILAVCVPLSANLMWRRAVGPLMTKRLVLLGAFAASCLLCEYVPVGWTFTFVLFPFAFLILIVGFAFMRRKPASFT